jgi:hypothetical protein
MPMPTTRRERYLYYRARAWKRHRRNEKRASRASIFSGGLTGRQRDLSGCVVQLPPIHAPKYVQSPRPPHFWEMPGRIKPDFQLWGVVPQTHPRDPSWAADTHFRRAFMFYAFRRVKHVRRLKHYPWLPYKQPLSAVPWWASYPFEFYPSGRPNPRFPHVP